MEKIQMQIEGAKFKFESKMDIYNIMKYQIGYFLPSYRRCPMLFLKDIMNGTKKALKTSELQLVEVPNFSELAVKNLWPAWKINKYIMDYFPDYKDSELPERNYLFGVVGTLYNKELTIVVKKAYEHRAAHYKGKDSDLIEITPEMKEYLEKVIAYKTTPGRGVCMLKAKTIAKKKFKERIIFPANLQRFANEPKQKMRRLLNRNSDSSQREARRGDETMEFEEEKKLD